MELILAQLGKRFTIKGQLVPKNGYNQEAGLTPNEIKFVGKFKGKKVSGGSGMCDSYPLYFRFLPQKLGTYEIGINSTITSPEGNILPSWARAYKVYVRPSNQTTIEMLPEEILTRTCQGRTVSTQVIPRVKINGEEFEVTDELIENIEFLMSSRDDFNDNYGWALERVGLAYKSSLYGYGPTTELRRDHKLIVNELKKYIVKGADND